MSRKESEILRKIHFFGEKFLEGLEEEKYLDQMDGEGKTWNVIQLDGTLLGRGIRGMSLTGTDDQRLLIHE